MPGVSTLFEEIGRENFGQGWFGGYDGRGNAQQAQVIGVLDDNTHKAEAENDNGRKTAAALQT